MNAPLSAFLGPIGWNRRVAGVERLQTLDLEDDGFIDFRDDFGFMIDKTNNPVAKRVRHSSAVALVRGDE